MTASELLARGALQAESSGNHTRAAALYWAAIMVLEGHSVAHVELALRGVGQDLPRGVPPQTDEVPQVDAAADEVEGESSFVETQPSTVAPRTRRHLPEP
jgi:hypothetical protein